MGEIADRAWAWQALEEEYKDRIQTDFRLMKEIRGQGGRASKIANILKKRHGTSGHSLDYLDPADGVCGFISFNAKGVHVIRHSFDPDSDPEETDNDQETEIHFTWNDYARAVIHWMNGETWAEALNIPAKQKPGAAPADKKGQEDKTMTMLAKTTETRAMTLADYEARIHLYKEQGAMAYIGIGRTLTEAKEAGVVPHGQWEAWVQEVAGFTPRQAQRCMQVAEKVPEGSAMARLDISKALLLISSGLDEEKQEAIAEKAAREDTTVKALKEELRKAKLQVVQETGAAAEIREALKKAEGEREHLEQQLKATISAYQTRLDEETEKAYQQGQDDTVNINREMQEKIDILQQQLKQMDQARQANLDHANDLNARTTKVIREKDEQIRRLEEAYKVTGKALEEARETVPEKAALEMEALKRNQDDLLAAAADAEKRAADAEAELEALRAGGDPGRKPMAIQLGSAVGEFMRECSSMPFYPEELQKDRGAVISLLSNLEDWVDKMYAAIGMPAVDGEGAVE